MKKFLTLVTAVGLAVSLSAISLAQGAGPKNGGQGSTTQKGQKGQEGRRGGMMMRGKMMQEILAKLNLTADQKKKIEALQASTREKIKALRDKNKGGDMRSMRDQFRPIMEAHQKGMKDILTDAQEKKLEELMKEARAKRGGPGGPPKGGKGGSATGGGTTNKGGG